MTGFSEFTTEEMLDELLERKVAFRIHLKSGIAGDWDGAYDWADDGEWVAIRITDTKIKCKGCGIEYGDVQEMPLACLGSTYNSVIAKGLRCVKRGDQ